MRYLLSLFALLSPLTAQSVLRPGDFQHYVQSFNSVFKEDVINAIPEADAVNPRLSSGWLPKPESALRLTERFRQFPYG